MKNLLVIVLTILTTAFHSQNQGVELHSMNDEMTAIIDTQHFDGVFTFGELETGLLKWEGYTYDGNGYKEFFFTILNVEKQSDRTIYYVNDTEDDSKKKFVFLFEEPKMVVIEEEGVAPIVLRGDLKF